jgi:adenylate cyclase
MKNPFCFLLFFTFHFSIFICTAQSRIIDSLQQVLRNEDEDSDKVNTLTTLSEQLWEKSNYSSSMDYANTALQLADVLKYEKGKGDALHLLGINNDRKGNFSVALNNLQEGLSVFREIGNKLGISKCLVSIGNVYSTQGNYPKALDNYFEASDLCREIGDEMGSASVYGSIAVIYYHQQNYSKSMELFSKASDFYRKAGERENEIHILTNMGVIYSELGKYDTALEYNSKALAFSREIGDRGAEAVNLEDMGETYIAQGKYDTALVYELKSLVRSKETGDKNQYGYVFNDIGLVYLKQKKYVLSRLYLDSALHLSKEIGYKDLTQSVYSNKIGLDSATGDYKAELQDSKNYSIYRDSLKNEKTLQEELNNDFDKRQDSARAVQTEKDAVAAKEIETQKRIRNYIVIGLGIVLFFLVFVFIQRNKIAKEKEISEKERQRSDGLLLNILPAEVAEELKEKGSTEAKTFDAVSVIFTDFKGFTHIAEKLSAKELVAEIHHCFKGFDNIIHKYNIEKIKTIGDSYMAAGGLPVPNNTHARDVVNAALEIIQFMETYKQQRTKEDKPVFEVRIGINSGPVVAGIVGVKKFAYDIWGDTVNLASRMESSGEPGKVNISGTTFELIKNDFTCTYRGKIKAKNKGEVDMYFVN